MAMHQQSGMRYVFGGMFLSGISKVIEIRGDVAPDSASGERLFYHCLALLVLLGALACFIKGGRVAFRRIFKRGETETRELAAVFADRGPPRRDPPEDETFDPDIALARYFERKQAKGFEPASPATLPRPAPGGFGRKGL
ncbi:hypothetical protein KRR38_17575 [Novosphingobium sp. G106]|uniref:hypothetical protein n=1 Tax=Novosphingobium sp. G106 TaxID=2849500 RepID=UPI001C2D445C|nr:hypothetical protein [Novosphingobium sp. G106]MBV1689434.1 hypothetical protein [Novosphingobium sp. G106]